MGRRESSEGKSFLLIISERRESGCVAARFLLDSYHNQLFLPSHATENQTTNLKQPKQASNTSSSSCPSNPPPPSFAPSTPIKFLLKNNLSVVGLQLKTFPSSLALASWAEIDPDLREEKRVRISCSGRFRFGAGVEGVEGDGRERGSRREERTRLR